VQQLQKKVLDDNFLRINVSHPPRFSVARICLARDFFSASIRWAENKKSLTNAVQVLSDTANWVCDHDFLSFYAAAFGRSVSL